MRNRSRRGIRKLFADEEAIETEVNGAGPEPELEFGSYSLMKKRLRREAGWQDGAHEERFRKLFADEEAIETIKSPCPSRLAVAASEVIR